MFTTIKVGCKTPTKQKDESVKYGMFIVRTRWYYVYDFMN